ncbi:MAG: YncE family protein [Sphingomonas bacterium]|uniref:YncE family protein n=1 Tax=Sphingomonas bacterium TaxID=1895847 RepID=UPI00263577EA|nr:YncE family protein [Sphingomonas bacterium]MDB5706693.1 YncE family protein [Sphingomonas bacterium]
MSPLLSRVVLLASAALVTAAAPQPGYHVVRSIAVPDGSWDYARVDDAAGRLYVARNDNATVVDLKTDKVSAVGALVHGHAVVPITGGPMLLVTSGRDDSVRLIDTGTGRETAKITVGSDPDAALYDPATAHAVVMNAKAGTVSIIDPATAAVVRTITLKEGLEYGALKGSTLYVNNEDANEIETADIVSGVVGKAIPLTGCISPSGLGYDAARDRLIAACANGKAAVADLRTGHVTLLAIGLGPDAVIMDVARGKAFIPCGRDGNLAVIDIAGTTATVVGTIATEPGARTGALDPRDGTIYLPTAKFGPPATAGGRPVAIPGTAHILVVARQG